MSFQTLTAPSIHAALAEARRRFGDGVVLLESVPPEGDAPARVTVMLEPDEPRTSVHAPERPAAAPRPKRRYTTSKLLERLSLAGARQTEAATAPNEADKPPRFADALEAEIQTSQRLVSTPPNTPALTQTEARAGLEQQMERQMERQLQTLHDRLDAMERRFSAALIGTAQRWGAHPLFGMLLEKGMRPATLARLFNRLAEAGHDPETDPETLRWALAQELRRWVETDVPKPDARTQLFIGPSGAGKTSLLLKLAKDVAVYGRRHAGILVVLPEDEEAALQHNPTELYRRFGLPVQSVHDVQAMRAALDRVHDFDQILIDTPPLPLEEAAARRMLGRLEQITSEAGPRQVHLVVNATRTLGTLDRTWLSRLPLRPDALALTHLDETSGLGRVAEWMVAVERPVQFVSASPLVRDGVLTFSSGWLAERLLDL